MERITLDLLPCSRSNPFFVRERWGIPMATFESAVDAIGWDDLRSRIEFNANRWQVSEAELWLAVQTLH